MIARHIHIHVHDAFEESKHPRGEGGKFSSSAEIAAAVNAPQQAEIYETGAAHGGGGVGYYVHRGSHAEIHKNLSRAGFVRQSTKRASRSPKMGRSAAHYSVKEQHSSYTHPHGHTATIRTRTTPPAASMSEVKIYRHPGAV